MEHKIEEFYKLAQKYPKLKLLLVYKKLPDTTEPLQRELVSIDKWVQWNQSRRYFLFSNGSILRIGHSETDDYVCGYYSGQEFDVIGFVNAEEMSQYAIRFIMCCLRSTRRDFKPRIYYMKE
jgi:hypothetical protein